MGHIDKLIVAGQIRGCKAEGFQVLKKNIRIHDPHDHLLPKGHWNRGDPYLRLHAPFIRFDPPILGPSLFCHVESGQGFNAANNGIMNFLGKFIDRMQNPVDPHPHHNFIPFWFNMDIAGFLVKGVDKQVVDGIYNMMVGGGQLISRLQLNILFQVADIDSGCGEHVLCHGDGAFESEKLVDGLDNVGF